MADRVLSSGEARQAITQFQNIINGPLLEQINALNAQGSILSNPNVWDGNLAGKFRGEWPSVHQKLVATKLALEELREQIATINQNIMSAGGN